MSSIYNYKGYQISRIVDRTAINDNFNATVKGAELEATWEPMPGLKFNFAGGYEDTRDRQWPKLHRSDGSHGGQSGLDGRQAVRHAGLELHSAGLCRCGALHAECQLAAIRQGVSDAMRDRPMMRMLDPLYADSPMSRQSDQCRLVPRLYGSTRSHGYPGRSVTSARITCQWRRSMAPRRTMAKALPRI